jgi:hypothetical protein
MSRHGFYTFLLAILMAVSAFAQLPDTLKLAVPPVPGVQKASKLGNAVAISGDFVAVGGAADNLDWDTTGIVKVFRLSTGALVHVIRNPTPAMNDDFGWSVAMSGSRLAVSARRDSSVSDSAGSVYIYDLDGASPTTPVLFLGSPSPSYFGRFGMSLAMSGSRLAVAMGSPSRVYLYDLAGSSPSVP